MKTNYPYVTMNTLPSPPPKKKKQHTHTPKNTETNKRTKKQNTTISETCIDTICHTILTIFEKDYTGVSSTRI